MMNGGKLLPLPLPIGEKPSPEVPNKLVAAMEILGKRHVEHHYSNGILVS
jgi:hypothetical protein